MKVRPTWQNFFRTHHKGGRLLRKSVFFICLVSLGSYLGWYSGWFRGNGFQEKEQVRYHSATGEVLETQRINDRGRKTSPLLQKNKKQGKEAKTATEEKGKLLWDGRQNLRAMPFEDPFLKGAKQGEILAGQAKEIGSSRIIGGLNKQSLVEESGNPVLPKRQRRDLTISEAGSEKIEVRGVIKGAQPQVILNYRGKTWLGAEGEKIGELYILKIAAQTVTLEINGRSEVYGY